MRVFATLRCESPWRAPLRVAWLRQNKYQLQWSMRPTMGCLFLRLSFKRVRILHHFANTIGLIHADGVVFVLYFAFYLRVNRWCRQRQFQVERESGIAISRLRALRPLANQRVSTDGYQLVSFAGSLGDRLKGNSQSGWASLSACHITPCL